MRNSKEAFDKAKEHTPTIAVELRQGWFRHDVVKELQGSDNVGIELGVAAGGFSRRMLESEKFRRLYGVDMYAGGKHDTNEYLNALRHVGFSNPTYSLLRMDFESALSIFDDNYFDFIYIDGFAHTGEEGGKTILDWARKLKLGGIIGGDDYHADWPLVTWAVNDFAKRMGTAVYVTSERETANYSRYPTWFLRKERELYDYSVDPILFDLAMKEKKRVASKKGWATSFTRKVKGKIMR